MCARIVVVVFVRDRSDRMSIAKAAIFSAQIQRLRRPVIGRSMWARIVDLC